MSDLKSTANDQQVATSVNQVVVQAVAPPPQGAILFDDFSSGDLNGNSGIGNWFNETALVKVVHANQMRESSPRSGSYCLEFDYRSGASTLNAEIRFKFNSNPEEVWLRLDLYIPTDYYHDPGVPNNNKFFYIWGGNNSDYSNFPNTPGVSTQSWYGGSSQSKLRPKVISSGTNVYYQPDKIWAKPSDLGTWIELIWHIKQPTSANNDGVIEIWKTPEGGTRELISSVTDGDFYQASQVGYTHGYLMGSAHMRDNPAGRTTFYMDNVLFSTESLL